MAIEVKPDSVHPEKYVLIRWFENGSNVPRLYDWEDAREIHRQLGEVLREYDAKERGLTEAFGPRINPTS